MTGTGFGARLRAAMDARGPLCVGIDPHPQLMDAWGLPDDPSGLEHFARGVVEALGGQVAVFKPQSAFFERHGSAGIVVLERVLADIRAAGALILLDVKRGDIGSTVVGYADAYLDPGSPLCADAVTAHPYLGFGSLQPLVGTARRHGNGVFVLAQTSNPEGREVQDAVRPDGRSVAATIYDHIADANAGAVPLGSVGAVVGATVEPAGVDFGRLNGPLLAPGLGAQGASATDLRTLFGAAIGNVVPATSRDVLDAGPTPGALQDAAARWADAVVALR